MSEIRILNEEARMVPLEAIQPHPENPNKGNEELLAESMEETGFYGSLVVQRSTGYILAGNHRFLVALDRGLTEIPVVYVDVDDTTAVRIMLADNEIARRGEWDSAAVLDHLQLFADNDFRGTGFTTERVEEIIDQLGAEATTHDFEGEYAVNQKAVDLQGDLLRESAGMREIVLALPKDEAAVFADHVATLMRAWKTNAVREVVQRAVHEAATANGWEPPEEGVTVLTGDGTPQPEGVEAAPGQSLPPLEDEDIAF